MPRRRPQKRRGIRPPLTLQRFEELVRGYQEEVKQDRQAQVRARGVIYGPPLPTPPSISYPIVNEILKDFGRTRGLKVLGIGVGYGQLLFFLKKFMRAKTAGIELSDYSKNVVRGRKLGIRFHTPAGDPKLREHLGQFDITYSVNLFDEDAIRPKAAAAVLANAAKMTKPGGKSYHVIPVYKNKAAITPGQARALGFQINLWAPINLLGELTGTTEPHILFIKLTKL